MVAADQTLNLVYDLRDLPVRDTLELPVVDLAEGETIYVNTSSAWLESRQKTYEADVLGEATVLIDEYIPYDAKEGDYTEKIIIWTSNTRSVITVKIKLAKTVKRSDLTYETLDLYTGKPIKGVNVSVYSEDVHNGTTDKNGLVLLENIREGCWDVLLSKSGYREESSYICMSGNDQEYTNYLIHENKTNITRAEEMLAYRNLLSEHEDRLRSLQEFSDSFIIQDDSNKTCPRQDDFDTLEADYSSLMEEVAIWKGVANVTAYQNVDVVEDIKESNKKLKWALGILAMVAITMSGYYYLVKKKGVFGSGGVMK